ncbi:hypothetical protein ACIQVT_13355 [Streptomyces sp. NPDC100445]|uniref:hypothetical protein n=1 Tax=Streptomyces sp. NPDC100445 TaxID=3366102 RepID=UPI00381C9C9A
MTESNSGTTRKSGQDQGTASKARRTADKATAPAGRAAKKTAAASDDATSAVKAGAGRTAEVTGGAVRTAARGVETGRQALVTASGQVATTARTAWTVVAHRKLVAAGVSAGLTAVTVASYAMGRRAERSSHGPLTRLTQGRI